LPDEAAIQGRVEAEAGRRSITPTYAGPAVVAAYSVVHDRTGEAVSALAICDLPDGSRTYARSTDPQLLAEAEKREWVGTEVSVTTDASGVNRIS
jgi:acetyl-CoA C-acetyltransferase